MSLNQANRVYEDVFEMLPSESNPTPLVRIRKLNPAPDFLLYAKLEWFNPFGSVKDRAAWAMLMRLEAEGKVGPGHNVVEPTSGNTGLSLASLASARGYKLRAIVPGRIPKEKKILLKIAGADLEVLNDDVCPAPGLGDGSINRAKSHAKASPQEYSLPNQYENEENVRAHMETTGVEIWKQTEGRITHFFAAMGTCGTLTGTGRFLKSKNPAIQVIGVAPSEGHDVPGLRNISQLHVSKLFDSSVVDDILEIDFELAYDRALDLSRKEGLLAGPSSGLILEGATHIAAKVKTGLGVMMFPDNIFKYLSSMVKHHPELEAEGFGFFSTT
ncbi:MAG TPA: cysteine synthase family protein [Verrucomicrobiae bacterium]|jgi:cysteine synthase|nr:cysteine synthase family protein [Verrucomicrobiae bacterium]